MNLTSDFRNAMAQLGSAITIITTDGPAGRFGFTASAVCSVTDSPPTLLVCMNRSSFAHGKFQHNGVLCVNVLSGQHQQLSGIFANGQIRSEERFLHDELLGSHLEGSQRKVRHQARPHDDRTRCYRYPEDR